MFGINDRELKEMERRLTEVRRKAIPFATRKTLDDMAFFARTEAQKIITDKMVLRNRFTISSIRVDRAKGSNISTQRSVIGSIASYMDEQEYGGRKRGRGGAVAIPTAASAGQAGRRTRLPRAAFKMGAIALRNGGRRRGANRKQQNAIAIATSKGGFAFLDLGNRKGIFKIDKKGNPRMMHDLTRRSVTIPATKTILPASNKALDKRFDFYRRALEFQLSRL